MKKKAILAFTLLSLAATQAWAIAWKVQPGVGVGPVMLGSDAQAADHAARAIFTPQELQDDFQKFRFWMTYKEGLEIEVERGKILQIVIHFPYMIGKQGQVDLEAEGGIRVGSTVQQMEQAYGKGYSSHLLTAAKGQSPLTYYAYLSKGIGLTAQNGKIIEIAIWPKK